MDIPLIITNYKARLNSLLERMKWSEEDVIKNFNSNSLSAPQRNIDAENAASDEPLLPISCSSNNCVILGKSALQKLLNDSTAEVPEKFSDIQVNFNREQKLKIYNYVLENTEKHETQDHREPGGMVSFADIVAAERREKKKRRKHRTSKPTYIEEVRGLIDLQMQALEKYMRNKELENQKKTIRSRSRVRMDHDSTKGNRDQRKRYRSTHRNSYSRKCGKKSRSRSRNRSNSRHKKRRKGHHKKKYKHRSRRSRS